MKRFLSLLLCLVLLQPNASAIDDAPKVQLSPRLNPQIEKIASEISPQNIEAIIELVASFDKPVNLAKMIA